jgi:hypothetical protein
MRFQVLTAGNVKTFFWDVTPYSLVDVSYRAIALMLEAV